MHVLHLLDHSLPLHSGYAFRSAAIIHWQRLELGWSTSQLTGIRQGSPTQDHEVVDGVTYLRTAASRVPWLHWPLIRHGHTVTSLAARLRERVTTARPTLLHAHSPALNGLAAWWVAQRCHLPLVYELRGLWEDAAVTHGTSSAGSLRYRSSKSMETWLLHRANSVVTICEGLKNDLMERGIPPDRITIVPNAVEPTLFQNPRDPDECHRLRQQWQCSPDDRIIAFIGSFYAYEGLSLLLQALPSVLQHHPQALLMLIGGGPEEERLKHEAHHRGVEKRLRFTGRLPHAATPDYYRLAELMVYPRLSSRLTELVTPLKPLEAMAANCALVASDVGGHRELIQPGTTGWLHRPGDADHLAAAINHLLDHPELAQTLRQQALVHVNAHRQWQSTIHHYTTAYTRALVPATASRRNLP